MTAYSLTVCRHVAQCRKSSLDDGRDRAIRHDEADDHVAHDRPTQQVGELVEPMQVGGQQDGGPVRPGQVAEAGVVAADYLLDVEAENEGQRDLRHQRPEVVAGTLKRAVFNENKKPSSSCWMAASARKCRFGWCGRGLTQP